MASPATFEVVPTQRVSHGVGRACQMVTKLGAVKMLTRLYVCMCFCVRVSLCLFLSLSLSVCLSRCVYAFMSVCDCVYICFCMCNSLCLSLWCVSACATVCAALLLSASGDPAHLEARFRGSALALPSEDENGGKPCNRQSAFERFSTKGTKAGPWWFPR